MMTTPSSPDLREFVDLSIFDVDPQSIYDTFAINLGIDLPTWVPREGNIEVLLAEALALPIAELMYAVNRLPNAIIEVLMQLYDVYRDLGQPMNVTLTFNAVDNAGYSIPQGTQASLYIGDGIQPIVFTTDDELTIVAGDTSGTITATGDRYTVDGNTTPLNTEVAIVTGGLTFVDSILITQINQLGRGAEDDSAWIARGSQRLAQLSSALVLPSQFEAAALEQVGVFRAKGIDNWNPAQSANPGNDGGYITVAVYGDGNLMSAQDKSDLLDVLTAKAQANLAVTVIDATVRTVDVTCTVIADSNASTTDVQNAVVTAIQGYLNYATWDWSQTVRYNELIRVIGSATGVAYVENVATPTADVIFDDVAPLVVAGTINVTVLT